MAGCTLLPVPALNSTVPAVYGSTPGFALGLTCPAVPDDTYWHETGSTINSSTQAAVIGAGMGTLRPLAQYYHSICSAYYTFLGSQQDGSESVLGGAPAPTPITPIATLLGRAEHFSGGTEHRFGSFDPVCPDEAQWDGIGGDPNGNAVIMVGGNQCLAKTDHFDLSASTGSQSITGVGFQPDAIIFLGCFSQNFNSQRDGGNFMMGAVDAALNQWTVAARTQFYSHPYIRRNRFLNDKCITHIAATSFAGPTTVDQIAELTSMDVDGFTINLTAAGLDSSGDPMHVAFLAIKVLSGDGISVGVAEQGDATISAGFAPDTMMFASAQLSNGGVDGVTTYLSMGAVDTNAVQRNYWAGSESAASLPPAYGYASTASAIRFAEVALTTLAEADVTLTGTGANLTWLVDDGNPAEIGWIAFQVDSIPHRPDVVTDAATGVTSISATLNGTITPNQETGDDVTYYFEYGPTIAYGSTTTPGVAGDGFSPVPVSAPIDDLTCGTEYHYRVVAVDPWGCVYPGEDVTFETLACGWRQIRY